MKCDENLTRSALGRLAVIGELYDIRNESLKSLSLFSNNNSVPKFIKCVDVAHTEYNYSFTENISERFELLKVEPELQMNVLLGLVKLEGSGKFLSEEKKSGKTVKCSVMSQIRTVHEKFFGSPKEILSFVDLDVLKDPQYTHVVTEITWGANCLLTMEYTNTTNSSKKEIEGRLEASLAKLKILSIKGGGQLDKNEVSFFNNNNMSIKINADVIPDEGWPTTVEEFCQLVANVPKLLQKYNDGKGKPLSYVVMPLAGIRKLAQLECAIDNFIIKKIDEGFLGSMIFLFEEIVETKQKLHDLYTEMKNQKKYIRESSLKATVKTIESLSVKESDLKTILSEEWIQVRTGNKTLRDMIRRVEKFKCTELNLLLYNEYLESCNPIISKLSTISNYISRGVLYLGRGETFRNVQADNMNHEFIVLVTSSELEKADPDLSRSTSYYFLNRVGEKQPDTKYVVVDLDFTDERKFFSTEITKVRCFHLKHDKVFDSDLLATFIAEAEMNFARPLKEGVVNISNCKPGNRTTLEMICPGFPMTCPSTAVEWTCFECKTKLEFDFNQYFYCRCGKCLATSFEYRCSNGKHGTAFIPADPQFLKERLSKLNPLQELNILFLGQTGVGKSTFINSIVNYLTYDTVEAAKEHGVICTIPISIPFFSSKTRQKHMVRLGEDSVNEVTVTGDSSTQFPHTYTFIWNKKCVRIIDSPGLGDVRGIQKDKENMKNIIDHLAYLKTLHGVCILIKANDNKFNAVFKYCIKELLANLHKSVLQNIVFCFTNSRNYLYSPGEASIVLERVLQEAGIGDELQLGRHNMFSFDNEAFLYLCSLKCPDLELSESIQSSFAESWKISLEETRLLFETIDSFHPHILEETITLVKARSRVLSLTKPLAEVCKTIQQNKAFLERQQKEVEESNLSLSELQKKLHLSEIYLVPEPLKEPRTVCTSTSCVELFMYEGTDIREVEYKQHCHEVCYVRKVTPKTVNNVLLKGCLAMDSNGKCKTCGCGWEVHMHITYSQKRETRTIINKKIQEDINKKKSERDKKNELVSQLQSHINKYKEEEEIIIQASVKFGAFLKKNAITVFNDSVSEYLEYLIEVEEGKPQKSETEKKILKNLQDTLNHYNAEVKVIDEVLKQGNLDENLNMDDMKKLEESLYKLELTGQIIKDNVNASRSGSQRMMMYSETPLYFKPTKASGNKYFSYISEKYNSVKSYFKKDHNNQPTTVQSFGAMKRTSPNSK